MSRWLRETYCIPLFFVIPRLYSKQFSVNVAYTGNMLRFLLYKSSRALWTAVYHSRIPEAMVLVELGSNVNAVHAWESVISVAKRRGIHKYLA